MVLPVEFEPPTMYSTQPNTRAEFERLVRAHHQANLLGKDGRIYDKAVVILQDATSTRVAVAATRRNTAPWNTTLGEV
ncbi:hypothetical protein NUU61_007859 [Penicillium alfredii]|uniref:Uncharacterized protein n=1 Tax=Penicillium alfredii TaxID=1506179 RepID=A0A9W9JZE8_9EURO|nr:uncharacterized protein NUU61_007859 [Penicillium alfredii]KAJ5086552.1 hypothetical protein NUU61_007859 [Penicillium alfredii]